jgi:transcriptional regulator with XRE-family HTH domain
VEKSRQNPQYECLQTLLRALRQEAQLTQVQLADKLQQPQSFVSKYEAGERRLDVMELRQVCLALGIFLGDFVKRFEKEIA